MTAPLAALALFAALGARAADAPPTVTLPAPPPPPVAASSEDAVFGQDLVRIIETYQDGGSTRFILQSRQPLVTGRSVYAGIREEALTVGELMSRTSGVHYYAASAPGKLTVRPGDKVVLAQTKKVSLPTALVHALKAGAGFEQKSVAEVTAVQGDRLLVDKGTLHEVHERDLFRIFDASGTLKGVAEVRGIGDFQSSAILDNKKAARTAAGLTAQPGDYAIFMGQRRLFGIGLLYGTQRKRQQMLYAFDRSQGGGLLWSMTFYNGWGVEALFGMYGRDGKDSTALHQTSEPDRVFIGDERAARFIAPVWLKKNFFHPSLVSPFLAAGGYLFSGEHAHETKGPANAFGVVSPVIREKIERRGVYPVVGMGLELFPTRFFRPRFEVRHFFGPNLTARGNIFRTSSTFFSVGVLSSW